MKANLLVPAVALLGFSIQLVPTAHADNLTGWYGGVSVGQSKAKDMSASDLDATLAQNGLTSSSSTVDNTDTGWKLFGGYQFNQYFALEGGYVNLGKGSFNTTVTAVNGSAIAPTNVSGTFKAEDGVFLNAVGTWPINEQFAVFGKIGAYSIKAKLSASASGVTAADSSRNSDLTYGVGVSYDFTKNLGFRGEWETFKNVGNADKTGKTDIELISAGLVYKF